VHVPERHLDQPVTIPARLTCIALASVPVPPPYACSWNGIVSRSAVSTRRSASFRFALAPRRIAAPRPRVSSDVFRLSIDGKSVANVTSTAIPICGSMPNALVRAPRRPISS
jgi:hypothetical protein